VLTSGGPADATKTLSIDIYLQGFRNFDMGVGSAMSLVLLIITTLISLIYWRYLSQDIEL
jgi:ABC-type sugar transport system permease subunit